MDYEFYIKGEKQTVAADYDGKQLTVDNGNSKQSYAVTELGNGKYILRQNAKNLRLTAVKADGQIFVITEKNIYSYGIPSAKDSDSFGADQAGVGDKSKVAAPMPGKVIKLLVKEGDVVEPKQKLVIVEAMKMENPVVAPYKAEVIKINCAEGELVDSDTLLIELNEIE